jgi:hypothetical protein
VEKKFCKRIKNIEEICCGETAPLLYISPVLYPLAIEI